MSDVFNGGRSSMVELQIVVLAVAGSSPVGRPATFYLPKRRCVRSIPHSCCLTLNDVVREAFDYKKNQRG